MGGHVRRLIQHEEKLSAVFALRHPPEFCNFYTHKHRWCFNCYIVFPGRLARSDFF